MCYTQYALTMPNQPKTPNHSIRVPRERWDAIDRRAKAAGSNRTEIVNALLAWWLRERGAKLPKRPELEPASADGEPEAAEQQPSE